MSEETRGSASGPSLPDAPNLDWLRKQAKRRLAELRATSPDAKLADAQFDLAKQYGFPSWRALKSHIDSLTVDGQLFDAAKNGDVNRLIAMLDEHSTDNPVAKLGAVASVADVATLVHGAQSVHVATQ